MSYAYIKYLLDRIFSFFDNVVIKAIISIWLFFAGIHVYIYAVFALILLDVTTGIYASTKQGQKFTSEYLKKGLLEKLALYLILLIAAFCLETVFKSIYEWDKFFVVFFVTVLITTYETVSIFENIQVINPKLSFLTSLIKLSKSLNQSAIKYAEKKIQNVELPSDEKKEEINNTNQIEDYNCNNKQDNNNNETIEDNSNNNKDNNIDMN